MEDVERLKCLLAYLDCLTKLTDEKRLVGEPSSNKIRNRTNKVLDEIEKALGI